jgi:ribosomal protein S18 acetylase RimI-like enzyme
MSEFEFFRLAEDNITWAANLLKERWGSTRIVSRGRVYQADTIPGFVAYRDGTPTGLVTYNLSGDECEIVSLDSILERAGAATGMIEAVKAVAIRHKCRRIWLITTNDNTPALRFYQKRGFNLRAVYPDAINRSRQLKPEIPLLGNDDIPIRDEIELEMIL